jgi:hypothetical protein
VSEHFRSEEEPLNPQQSPERLYNYKVREVHGRSAIKEKAKRRKQDILKAIVMDEKFKQALEQFVCDHTTNSRSKNLSVQNDAD